MSLILDALRKADAERERDAVPGLNAQPVPPSPVEAQAATQSPPVLWIVIGAAVGLASAFAVFWAGREPPPAPVPAVGAPVVASPAPMDAATAAPAEAAAPRATPPAPVAVPAPWPAGDSRGVAKPAPPANARAEPRPRSAASAAPPAIPRDQLPADVRAQLPPLAVGGSMYSSTPANRTLIVDGRLYREGDRVAAGLTLEEIRLKSAVFAFKGHRFEVRF
ncbi:MAG: hypothetical protein OHK0044_26590 [Burkholderiaceae bacterium]